MSGFLSDNNNPKWNHLPHIYTSPTILDMPIEINHFYKMDDIRVHYVTYSLSPLGNIFEAIQKYDIKAVRKIICSKVFNINERDWAGHPPLYYAVRHYKIFELLIHYGAVLTGDTLIQLAKFTFKTIPMYCALIKDQCKALINYIDTKGWTALHHAVYTDNRFMCTWLILNGANMFATTKIGNSHPVHLANSPGILIDLIKLGYPPNLIIIKNIVDYYKHCLPALKWAYENMQRDKMLNPLPEDVCLIIDEYTGLNQLKQDIQYLENHLR